MNIAESEKIHFVWLVGLGREGVSEKQKKVDLVSGDTCTYLLIAAL